MKNIDNFSIKKSDDLESQQKLILDTIKENSGKKSGEIFAIYQQKGGIDSYRSFHRKLTALETSKFIMIKHIDGGKEGKTSILEYNLASKRLTDF